MESEDYHFYQGLVYLLENDVSTLGYDLTFSTEVSSGGGGTPQMGPLLPTEPRGHPKIRFPPPLPTGGPNLPAVTIDAATSLLISGVPSSQGCPLCPRDVTCVLGCPLCPKDVPSAPRFAP